MDDLHWQYLEELCRRLLLDASLKDLGFMFGLKEKINPNPNSSVFGCPIFTCSFLLALDPTCLFALAQ